MYLFLLLIESIYRIEVEKLKLFIKCVLKNTFHEVNKIVLEDQQTALQLH